MLFCIWYFCTGFSPHPSHLHKLFHEEGGDAEGMEAGGKVRISQDPAPGISGAQREPGLTFLNTRGNKRIGSLARRRGLWLTYTSCAELTSQPGLADVSFKMTQAISQLTPKGCSRSRCVEFLLIHRDPQIEAVLRALIRPARIARVGGRLSTSAFQTLGAGAGPCIL